CGGDLNLLTVQKNPPPRSRRPPFSSTIVTVQPTPHTKFPSPTFIIALLPFRYVTGLMVLSGWVVDEDREDHEMFLLR
ncbi:hypothetical protein M8C21_018080, partial [Ambrosia artemisiifolia]